MAAAGRTFANAGVVAAYCLHGTFAGNDALGLYTELERFAPRFTASLRRTTKGAFDWLIGETGNYTQAFAERMESALSAGAERPLPVRVFHWASQNHHISRADAAVRLIDELAKIPPPSKGGISDGHDAKPRVLLWSHSHGGNALAILTNLLGADEPTRAEFFEAAGVFHRKSSSRMSHFPVWHRVEQLLADPSHPLRGLAIDVVTFGTPVRYGWDTAGCDKLLHIVNHRAPPKKPSHVAPFPPNLRRLIAGADGDFIQQLGIAGTNLPPLPLAWRTFLADRRLGRLLQRDLPREWLHTRLNRGARVHHEGTSLLVNYADPERWPHRHLFGHAPYTRSRWLALHCELVAEHFYADPRLTV